MINMSEWLCGDDDVQSKWSDLMGGRRCKGSVRYDDRVVGDSERTFHCRTRQCMMEIQNKEQKSKGIRAKVGGTSKDSSQSQDAHVISLFTH